ncbi:MAG: DUF4162 domain-containing protein [Thermoproteota archaeon]
MAREEGKTILLSTHNLYEAQALCDRIAILDRGKVTACDTPDNVRYAMFDEKTFEITFAGAEFDEEHGKMVDELEALPGVHGATPDVDPEMGFRGLSIRVDKDTDLSSILEVVMKSELRIRTVNTKEPSLEDAFMAITGRQDWQRGQRAQAVARKDGGPNRG